VGVDGGDRPAVVGVLVAQIAAVTDELLASLVLPARSTAGR